MVFGMNKGIFDGTYLKHPTRSGACQSSGAKKALYHGQMYLQLQWGTSNVYLLKQDYLKKN